MKLLDDQVEEEQVKSVQCVRPLAKGQTIAIDCVKMEVE